MISFMPGIVHVHAVYICTCACIYIFDKRKYAYVLLYKCNNMHHCHGSAQWQYILYILYIYMQAAVTYVRTLFCTHRPSSSHFKCCASPRRPAAVQKGLRLSPPRAGVPARSLPGAGGLPARRHDQAVAGASLPRAAIFLVMPLAVAVSGCCRLTGAAADRRGSTVQ
jgi:hypothetical protein